MRFLASPRRELLVLAAVLAAAAIGVFVIGAYPLLMLSLVCIWAMLGLSWNILGGYGGLISFGHAAFFGGGAYTVAILFHDHGLSPWIGCALGAMVSTLLAVLVGFITFRLKGHYFSLAMLAYPLALIPVFTWAGWMEVSFPLQRAHPALYMQFADPRVMPLILLGFLGLSLFVCLMIERRRLGLKLYAIRQDELAAQSAGIATLSAKLLAIGISGGMAGLAGGLYGAVVLVVTPASVFGMLVSAQALIVAMFGGIGTAWGPLIGAAVLVPASEALNAWIGGALPGIQGVVFGLAIMAVILWRPQGIYWAVRDRFAPGVTQAPSASDAAPPAPHSPLPQANSQKAPGAALLQVQKLTVRFGGLSALDDVTLEVRQGEILGIIGPNGAGKTTLFNVVSGITRPESGSVLLEGKELVGLAPHQVSARGIARTFQTVRYFSRLSLLENVVVGAFGAHRDDRDALEAARATLARLGLLDRGLVPAALLTNRELRLLELARALAANPKLILMDECFAGLATADVQAMMTQIRTLAAEGMTIAIIEHTMHAMIRLADRFVVLDRGRVLASGPPDRVVREPHVVSAYLGKRWVEHAGA